MRKVLCIGGPNAGMQIELEDSQKAVALPPPVAASAMHLLKTNGTLRTTEVTNYTLRRWGYYQPPNADKTEEFLAPESFSDPEAMAELVMGYKTYARVVLAQFGE